MINFCFKHKECSLLSVENTNGFFCDYCKENCTLKEQENRCVQTNFQYFKTFEQKTEKHIQKSPYWNDTLYFNTTDLKFFGGL